MENTGESLRVGVICAAAAHAAALYARTGFAVLALKTVSEPRQHVKVPVECAPGWIAYSASTGRMFSSCAALNSPPDSTFNAVNVSHYEAEPIPDTVLCSEGWCHNGATHYPQQEITGRHHELPEE